MIGSLVLGAIFSFLGSVCVIAGVVIAVLETVRPPASGAFPQGLDWDKIQKLLEVIKGILEQFGKLKPGGQLLIVGLVLLGAGVYLLSSRPF